MLADEKPVLESLPWFGDNLADEFGLCATLEFRKRINQQVPVLGHNWQVASR